MNFLSRVEHLTHINELLREQLDKATAANQSAMADLHKLVHIRDELLAKEEEWNKEAQARFPLWNLLNKFKIKNF